MMNRQTVEQVRALIQEVDDLAQDVLAELDMDLDREVGGWKELDTPRAPAPSDYLTMGSKRTAALRRRSMDLTRKLAEMRASQP